MELSKGDYFRHRYSRAWRTGGWEYARVVEGSGVLLSFTPVLPESIPADKPIFTCTWNGSQWVVKSTMRGRPKPSLPVTYTCASCNVKFESEEAWNKHPCDVIKSMDEFLHKMTELVGLFTPKKEE